MSNLALHIAILNTNDQLLILGMIIWRNLIFPNLKQISVSYLILEPNFDKAVSKKEHSQMPNCLKMY